MKIAISKSELIKGTNIVSKAVPSKTVLDILECVLLSAQGNTLTLYSNNLEMAITTTTECLVENEGEIAVNAEMLCEMAKRLPDGDVIISQQGQVVVITAGDVALELPIADATQFPVMPIIDKDKSIEVPEGALKSMIMQTIFACSDMEKDEILKGLDLKMKDGKARMTGLDRKRAAIRFCDVPDTNMTQEVILPGKTMNEIRKILGDSDEDNVTISISDSLVMFSFGDTVLTSRIVAGTYVDVDWIIEEKKPIAKAIISKTQLYECFDRAMLFEKTENMKPVVFTLKDNMVNLFLKTARGVLNENISTPISGEPLKIGFDPRVFLDMLKVFDEDEVILEFCGENKPCFICSENEDFIYMVLPVTVKE